MIKSKLAKLAKVNRPEPETFSQAQAWDMNKNRYLKVGFCHRCAAQAAWGHQLGFSNVNPIGNCCKGKQVPENKDGKRVNLWVNK